MTRAPSWALVCLLASAATAAAQTSTTFLQTAEDPTALTTYTFASQNFGTAAADRMIVVASLGRRSGTTFCTTPTVTIGGVAATSVITQANNSVNCSIAAIHKALVPSGTSGSVVIVYPGAMLRSHIALYRSTGPQAVVASATGGSTAGDPTGTLTIAANGYGIGISTTVSLAATATWTGLTETYDEPMTSGISVNATGALLTPSTLQSGLTVTATWTASAESAGAWASWAPITNAVAATHYVTSGGNGSSDCTIGDPCTLTRAFALAGTATIPAGSWVSVAAGVYSQTAISTTGGGVSGFPVRFVGAGIDSTRITGTRTFLDGAGWSLAPSQTYTYRRTWDDGANYALSHLCQRTPVSNWTPIVVDDRVPPFTTSSFRVYSISEPVCYTPEPSVADVEATHCTYWNDTANNFIYMHPCMETAPNDADNYYAGSSGWGRVTYTGSGDYLTLEQMNVEHTGQSDGLKIDTSAIGTQLKFVKFLGARLWAEGGGTLGEDLILKGYAQQGPDNANCYSPVYGSRSCWNENGDGYLLLMGRQGTGISYNQTFRRITLSEGWNLYRMDGPNTLEYATGWGCANHGGQISGSGGTVRHSIFANCQDVGPYVEGESFNNVTIEHNILYPAGPWLWCSRDGNTQGGVTCPTAVTIRYNVFGNMLFDTLTTPALTSDCNVSIPRSAAQSSVMRITEVNGGGGNVSAVDMAAWQAATAFDDNSIGYPYTSWTDGSIFANFATQQTYPLDFTLAAGGAAALTTCGVRAGPDSLTIDIPPVTPVTRRLRFRRRE